MAPASAPWLVADIGGTNVRFGLVDGAGAAPRDIEAFRGADHAGPAQAARVYLQRRAAAGAVEAPRLAAFAVATAVTGDRVELTNNPWAFSCREVERELGLERLLVINDFEALALSLPQLHGAQVEVHGTLRDDKRTRAVVGPGTGLGVAALVHAGGRWHAVAGEGGHATLAPADDFESELLAWVRRSHDHVSAERLLSGTGLPLLHRAVAAVGGQDVPALTAAQIVARGVDGADPLCARTLDAFCAMLGGFAGNVALTLGARGGVYVGGGVVPRFRERFRVSAFRERFEAKGRFRAYLAPLPTALIVEPYAALGGAAAAIEAWRADGGPGAAA